MWLFSLSVCEEVIIPKFCTLIQWLPVSCYLWLFVLQSWHEASLTCEALLLSDPAFPSGYYISGFIPGNQQYLTDPNSCDWSACSVEFSWLTIVFYVATCWLMWQKELYTHADSRRAATAHSRGRRRAVCGGVKALNTACSTMCKSEGKKRDYKRELKFISVLKKLLFIIAPVKSEALELFCCRDYKKKKMFRLLKFRFFKNFSNWY